MPTRPRPSRRRHAGALAAAAAVGALALAPRAVAQSNPILDLFTTTTVAPPTTAKPKPTTTTSATGLGASSSKAPAGAQDAADGTKAPADGIVVPPEAQKIINAVRRSPANDSGDLVAALAQLTALGADEATAYKLGMGRFPVAGVAHFSDDWLLPRYGPGFRFHLGTDMLAAYGTPVRAPVDGVVHSSNDTLGGLSVRVVMPDKTFFYLAHLSGLVEGFTEGMAVSTGDIVGYVGDSGNAKGTPHLHIGVYPKGGAPVDPKPVLDQFLAEAEANLPAVVAAYQAAHPPAPAAPAAGPDLAALRRLRPMLATGLLHPLASGGDGWSPANLYVLATAPARNSSQVLRSAFDDLGDDIDWSSR